MDGIDGQAMCRPCSVHIAKEILTQLISRPERPTRAAWHALEVVPALISDRDAIGAAVLSHGDAFPFRLSQSYHSRAGRALFASQRWLA